MIFLGIFKASIPVFFAANFHNDTGMLEDPTSPEAQIRDTAGVWTSLAAPTKQNAKPGHYGSTVDTTSFSPGQYTIRMAGTVTTAKTVATEFCFQVKATTAEDVYARLGAPSGASVLNDIASMASQLATQLDEKASQASVNAIPTNPLLASSYVAPDNQSILAIKTQTDDIASMASQLATQLNEKASQASVNAIPTNSLLASSYVAPDNQSILAIKTQTDDIASMASQLATQLDEKASQASVNAIPTNPLLASSYVAPDNQSILAIKTQTDDIASMASQLATQLNEKASQASVNAIPTNSLLASSYVAPDNQSILAIKTQTEQLAFTGGKIDANATVTIPSEVIQDIADAVLTTLAASGLTLTDGERASIASIVDTVLSTLHGSGRWDSRVVLPAMHATLATTLTKSVRPLRIARGDTRCVPFDFGSDYSGWTARFGARRMVGGSIILTRLCIWTNAQIGQGHFELTAADTSQVGTYLAEVELSQGDNHLTLLQFDLVIFDDVIK